jgi:ATP-dependent Clp endopeptidase proteolytic subunit ClpP
MSNAVQEELVDVTRAKLVAEARKLDAEARKAEAEAENARLGSEFQQVSLDMSKLQLAEMEYTAKAEQARDERHHVYWFTGVVTDTAVKACIARLTQWDRLDPTCDIKIVFNSPGGSVVDGMALFDFIVALRERHHVTTEVRGYAASIAGILLQAGTKRVIGPESYLMIHEISAGTMGKIGEIKDSVKFYDMVCARVVDIFVNRSGGRCSKEHFKANWERIDWWLTSEEAVALGFADEVG